MVGRSVGRAARLLAYSHVRRDLVQAHFFFLFFRFWFWFAIWFLWPHGSLGSPVSGFQQRDESRLLRFGLERGRQQDGIVCGGGGSSIGEGLVLAMASVVG